MEFIYGNEKIFFDFISDLNDKDIIALVSHTDGDGIASALIIDRVIDPDYLELISYDLSEMKELVRTLKAKKVNKIIFSDMNFGNRIEILKKFEKFAKILMIDHHETPDFNSEKIIHFRTNSQVPASYGCYYLFSKTQKIPGWIAALGILSDRVDYNEKNVGKVFEDFSLNADEETKKKIFDKMMMLSRALIYFKDDMKKVFSKLQGIKSINELDALKKYSDEVEKEINYYLDRFEKDKEDYGKIIIFELNPKFSIKSYLINRISMRNKDDGKIYIFVNKKNKKITVSTRCQSKKVNLVEMLEKALKDIEGDFGGHKAAAGASMNEEDYLQFKKNLLMLLN